MHHQIEVTRNSHNFLSYQCNHRKRLHFVSCSLMVAAQSLQSLTFGLAVK
jgi:hypothetical protein